MKQKSSIPEQQKIILPSDVDVSVNTVVIDLLLLRGLILVILWWSKKMDLKNTMIVVN